MTLGLAGLAGFSTGWSVRPVEVHAVFSFKEKYLLDAGRAFRITPEERAEIEAILDGYERALQALRDEFDSKYGEQVTALETEYNARLGRILTPAKRR
jgi:hypothetical protein